MNITIIAIISIVIVVGLQTYNKLLHLKALNSGRASIVNISKGEVIMNSLLYPATIGTMILASYLLKSVEGIAVRYTIFIVTALVLFFVYVKLRNQTKGFYVIDNTLFRMQKNLTINFKDKTRMKLMENLKNGYSLVELINVENNLTKVTENTIVKVKDEDIVKLKGLLKAETKVNDNEI